MAKTIWYEGWENTEDLKEGWAQDAFKRALNRCRRSPISPYLKRLQEIPVPFDLEIWDIPTPNFCLIFGTPLFYSIDVRFPKHHTPALCRRDHHLGYVRGNIVTMSALANNYQYSNTLEQLVKGLKSCTLEDHALEWDGD
jgi:hypothetical protein